MPIFGGLNSHGKKHDKPRIKWNKIAIMAVFLRLQNRYYWILERKGPKYAYMRICYCFAVMGLSINGMKAMVEMQFGRFC